MHHVVLGSSSQHLAVLAAALGHTGRPLYGGNQRFQPEMFGFCPQGLTDLLRLMILTKKHVRKLSAVQREKGPL